MDRFAIAINRQGVNAGMSVAGRQELIPTLQTHEDNGTTGEQRTSRLTEIWRRTAKNQLARLAFFAAATMTATVACGHETVPNSPAATSTAGPSSGETAAQPKNSPAIFSGFETLTYQQQEARRAQIAQLDLATVQNDLSPLDKARWAADYRHVLLGDRFVTPIVAHSGYFDAPNNQELLTSLAQQVIGDYQDNLLRMAWTIQHKPELANDPRTPLALLGSAETTTTDYKLAQSIADSYTTNATNAEDYVAALHQTVVMFQPPTHVTATKTADAHVFTFTATRVNGSEAHFATTFYPSLDLTLGSNQDQPMETQRAQLPGLGGPVMDSLLQIS